MAMGFPPTLSALIISTYIQQHVKEKRLFYPTRFSELELIARNNFTAVAGQIKFYESSRDANQALASDKNRGKSASLSQACMNSAKYRKPICARLRSFVSNNFGRRIILLR